MTVISAQLEHVPAVGGRAKLRDHFGAWRALASVPAMVGSLLLLLVLFGWMGKWEGLLLLGWLASGVAIFSRAGERVAVVLGCGFRRPGREESALATVWSEALALSGIAAGDVDLYVQRSADLNAYAAGGRSVAITTGVLREFLARRLSSTEIQAVLVHELGHHATRATRFALITIWLALPCRVAARLVIGVGLATVGRRQPMRLLGLVVVAGVVVATVQAVQRAQIATALVLISVSISAVVCPLAEAWVTRRSEYAADRFAATCGVAAPLSAALRRMDDGRPRRLGWTQRALRRHPGVSHRVEALDAYSAAG